MNYYCEKCGECTGDDGKDQNIINAPGIEEGLCWKCEDQKEIEAKLEIYLEVQDMMEERAAEWIAEFGCGIGRPDAYNIKANADVKRCDTVIEFEYDYHSDDGVMGSSERCESGTMPLEALWDIDFIDNKKKAEREAQLERLKESEERMKLKAMKDKADRYEQYLKLAKEFDDET